MRARSTLQTPDIALIGPGNWGTSLAHALVEAKIPLREVVVRRANSRRSQSLPKGLPQPGWDRARLDAKILWLCVPDRAVESVAAELAARRNLHGQVVVHSSGVLTVEALEPARRGGARVAAVHPVMTFPARRAASLTGVLFGVEAPSPETRRTLEDVIRRVGGEPFAIRGRRKALYHAAGTLASPLLVSTLTAAMETARAAGLTGRQATAAVEALASATLANVFARGSGRSFSGPFARGDAATVKLHLAALAGHPILADVYRSLARHAIGSLPVRNARELRQALDEGADPKRDSRRSARGARRMA